MDKSRLLYAQESLDPNKLALHKDQALKAKQVCVIVRMSKPALYRSDLGRLRYKVGRSSFWSERVVLEWIRRKSEEAAQTAV
jgi:predicted DNA-binding transcriptional regulator AlpA